MKKLDRAYSLIIDLLEVIEQGQPEFYFDSTLVTECDDFIKLVDGQITLKQYNKLQGDKL